MRAAIIALIALFLGAALAVNVFTVDVVGAIGNAKVVPGDPPGFQFIQYCSGTAQWNCNLEPGICTSNCGTPSANGPQCLCPSVPAGQTLNLNDFPIQLRWGDPVPANVPGFFGTGVKSGFGFKPIVTQDIPATTSEFLVGTAVHFNQPIWAKGSNCGGWDLKIKITITPTGGGVPISGEFAFPLQLDETNNNCTRFFGDTGCWDNSFWADNPTALEWPSCNKDSEGLPRDPSNNYCCRYKTTNSKPCADKVWTLDTLDLSAPPIILDGIEYTLWLNGFSVPNQPGVRKSFFISQESLNTQADIYGRLVKACPPAGSCPVPPVLSPDGTACVCPITLPPAPTPAPTTAPPPPPTTVPPPPPTSVPPVTLPPLPPSPPATEPPTEQPTDTPVQTDVVTVPPLDGTITGGFTLPPVPTPTPTPTGNDTNSTAGAAVRGPGSRALSKAAVAGVVIAAVAAAAILAALVVFLIARGASNVAPGGALLGAGEAGVGVDNPLWTSPTTSHSNAAYVSL